MGYNISTQHGKGGQINVQTDRMYLEERFTKAPGLNTDVSSGVADATQFAANPNFEVLGTNHSSADVTFAQGGGIKLETDGATSDAIIILPHLDANLSAWTGTKFAAANNLTVGFLINTGSAITQTTVWAGLKLTNTSVVATDDDQAFFRYSSDAASGVWQGIDSSGGGSVVDTTTSTGVTVALSTQYKLEIKLDEARVPHYFINGREEATGNAIDSVDLIPYFGILGLSATAKHVYLRRMWISMDYPTTE